MTTWYTETDIDLPIDPDTDAGINTLADLTAALPRFGGITHNAKTGVATIRLNTDADTLVQAITDTLEVVATAITKILDEPEPPTRIEVMPLAAHLENIERGAGSLELAGASEVAEILGVVRQRVSQLANSHPDFPAPLAELHSGPVYDAAAIRAFNETWTRKAGRPAKKTTPVVNPQN